ncbi:MAG: putative porin [Bacteroidota bacterium]
MRYSYLLPLLILLLWPVQELMGQLGGAPPGARRSGGQQQQQQQREEEPDTINFNYLYPDNPGLELPFRDTALDSRFWQYDPIRQQPFDYAHLGNLGSPHQPLAWQPRFQRGFDVGFHQFDLYKLRHDQMPYYSLRKAFTDAYFSQGQTQSDAYFKAKFSRNFSSGINYSVDYKRINNTGAYNSQRATASAFGTGIWIHGAGGRYDSFFTYISNVIRHEDNGGIRQELLTDDNRDQEFSIPVFLSTADTRQDQRSLAYTQHFRLAGRRGQVQKRVKPLRGGPALPDSLRIQRLDSLAQPGDTLGVSLGQDSTATVSGDSSAVQVMSDTASMESVDSTLLTTPMDSTQTGLFNTTTIIASPDTARTDTAAIQSMLDTTGTAIPSLPKAEGRAFTLTHRIFYERSRFKFTDTEPAEDSLFYGDLQVDQRGLRHFVQGRQIENSLSLSTSSQRKGKAVESGTQRDLLEAGLTHSWYQLQMEPRDSTINNLFLSGRWNFTPSDRLQVRTYGHYGLWDQRGDYRLFGQLFFDLGKAGSLDVRGTSQQYSPNLVQRNFYIAQREVWNNGFDKPLENSLQATYYQPLSDTRLSGQLHLLTNYIYFDTSAIPQQDNGTISILQLIIQQNFQFWKFGGESWLMLQQISGDNLRMPSFYFKQNIYFKGKLFRRVLDTYIGLDLRLSSAFRGNAYQPLIGQFHLQNEQELALYPAVDFFMAFKVGFFRAFIRAENLMGYLNLSEEFFFQTLNQPYPFGAIRFGISWQFLD